MIVILSRIKSPQVIEIVEEYILTVMQPHFLKSLKKKDAPKHKFEVFFWMLELSDNIALSLYDKRIVKRTSKYSKEKIALFSVCTIISRLILVAMYLTLYGGKIEQDTIKSV
jgi:hypothetical protein